MVKDLSCLLIDDDEDDREIFTIALKEADKTSKCFTAINGKDALHKLKADETFIPDFIFLDLNMPILNGKQCLQEIKKDPRLCRIPVTIYTTSTFQKDIEEVKELGAAYFLIKPSNVDDLSKILSAIFQKQTLPFFIDAGN